MTGLASMLSHCRQLLALAGQEKEPWEGDEKIRAAARYHLLLLGQAAKQVPGNQRNKDTAIPWDALQELPTIISEPWGASDEAVWGTIVAMGPLLTKIEALAGETSAVEVA